MNRINVAVNGISAGAERIVLMELEKLGVLVTCETYGECDAEGARCITTVRGNGICGRSLVKRESGR